MSDLPPRLSDQQRFILARISESTTGKHPMTRLSWAVAEEFDDGDRIADRQENAIEIAEESGDPGEASLLLSTIFDGFEKRRVLTEEHRKSFSRSIRRLADRELLTRYVYAASESRDPNTKWVEPTDEGRAAGEEIRRRHDDGRYSIRFDTL